MSRFHALTVTDIQQETRDAVSIRFAVPEEVASEFAYKQGQYLTLRTQIQGEEVRRSYSICRSVADNELRVAVKRVPGGVFSNYVNDALKVGQTLEAMPPMGNFYVDLDPERKAAYLAIAAGSGITPMLSIIKTTLETEPHSEFTLFYGNRSASSTMFREELEDLKNLYMGRFNLIYIMSREQQDIDLYNGRIDAEKCNALFDHWIDVPQLQAAFLCGPQAMIESISSALQAHGLEKAKVHFELFAPAGSQQQKRERQVEAGTQTGVSQVTVIADGRQISFELAKNSKNILDAGNEQGADLPYACKAGVCSTCRAKVVEGEVDMDANFALEDYEVEAGYVLTCQCYPVSDKLVVDYDQ